MEDNYGRRIMFVESIGDSADTYQQRVTDVCPLFLAPLEEPMYTNCVLVSPARKVYALWVNCSGEIARIKQIYLYSKFVWKEVNSLYIMDIMYNDICLKPGGYFPERGIQIEEIKEDYNRLLPVEEAEPRFLRASEDYLNKKVSLSELKESYESLRCARKSCSVFYNLQIF